MANAVLDGADGLLLGAETLRGLHPVLTVETVLRLCHAAEKHFDFRSHHEQLMGEAYEVGGGGTRPPHAAWGGAWLSARGPRLGPVLLACNQTANIR